MKDLEKQLRALSGENDRIADYGKVLRAKNTKLKKEQMDLISETENAQKETDSFLKKCADKRKVSQAELDGKDAEVCRAKKELSGMITSKEAVLLSYNGEFAKLQNRIGSLEKKYSINEAKFKSNLDAMKLSLTEKTKAVDAMKKKNALLTTQTVRLANTLHDLETEQIDIEKSLGSVTEEKAKAQAKVNELKAMAKKVTEQIELSNQRNDLVMGEIVANELILANKKDKIVAFEEKEKSLAVLERKLADQGLDLGVLNKALYNKEKILANRERALRDAQQKI